MTKTAVILGVGPVEGLGAYLAVKAAEEDLHVIVSGRTQTNLDAVVEIVSSNGAQATGIVADATDLSSVSTLIKKAEAIGPIDLAIYNAGNNFPGNFLTMDAEYFENAWRVCTLGGFLFAQTALKAMQERAVTIGGKNYSLDSPYFVLATQNPIEQEGTYPLPEAQLDRFMFSINLQYPTFDEEVEVVKRTTSKSHSQVDVIFSAIEILDFQNLIMKIPVADNVINYAVTLVGKSRPGSLGSNSIVKQYVDWGAGPRASQNLILAAKTFAVINNKLSPDIEDVQAVAIGVLRHRIIKNYKAESDGISIESIVESLF